MSYDLSKDIQADIRKYTLVNGDKGGVIFWFKAIVLITVWLLLYYVIVVYQSDSKALLYLLSVVWGVCSLLIIFNIGHDAVHAVVSRRKWVNNCLQYSFNLVGANAYSWRLKHNIAHHLHTNIEGKDFDTDLRPFMRLSSKTPYSKLFGVQNVTIFLIYPLFSLLIICIADFKIFFQTRQAGLVQHHSNIEWVILVLTKLYYITLVVVIPHYFGGFSIGDILIAFFSFQFLNGVIIALVFMPSHYFKGVECYDDRPINYNWYRHQISTTMDLSPNNSVLSFLLGGLNLNIAHHLDATFCHTHYFKLSKIIKDRLDTQNVSYHELGYSRALKSHYQYISSIRHELV